MNTMKNAWVRDLTSFFDSLGNTNIRSSIRKKRSSKISKVGSAVEDNSEHEQEEKLSQTLTAVEVSVRSDGERYGLNRSDGSEHCIKVKDAREIFERMASADHKEVFMPYRHRPQIRQRISAGERTSGLIADSDHRPIREAAEGSGVRTSVNAAYTAAKIHGQLSEKKKSLTKTPSIAGRRSISRKTGSTFKTVTTEADADRENDGVIIRMKNQESYYDTRAKYQSMLPEAPLHPLALCKKRRPSLAAQKAAERSLDTVDSECSRDRSYMHSILLRDTSLPSVDDNHNLLCKSGLDAEDDPDYEDLEPTEDYDSQSDTKVSQLISEGPQRIKWAETEEGKKLIAIKHLDREVIKWQEAQFEVITSEASYNRSLEVLVHHIYKSPAMLCVGEKAQSPPADGDPPAAAPVMTALQKHHLFSNILEIHICSGELLKALETRWRENPFIEDLSDILVDFSRDRLRPYITYLRNQQYQTATYNDLLTKSDFLAAVKIVEAAADCGKMNLSSFLLLPMQRLLRLKLLFAVVRSYIPEGYPVEGCDCALASLEALIKECSDQKMLMEQKEVIMKIYNRLAFKEQTGVSIGNKPLLKDGQMKVSSSNNKASKALRSSFIGRKTSRAQLYLFEDQLIIAKTRKLPMCLSSSDGREMVVDICPRSEVKFDDASALARPVFFTKNPLATNFKLVLDKGIKGSAEYVCEVESREALEEWRRVFCPDLCHWQQFDFNEVQVLRDFQPTSDAELELHKEQIVRIVRRLDDRRAIAVSGGRQGEIPLSHVQGLVPSPQTPPGLLLVEGMRASPGHRRPH